MPNKRLSMTKVLLPLFLASAGCDQIKGMLGQAQKTETQSPQAQTTPTSAKTATDTTPPEKTASAPAPSPASTAAVVPTENTVLEPKDHTKDLLAKLKTEDTDLPESETVSKIDPSTIPKDGIPKPIPGFGGVGETGYRVSYAKSKDPYLDSIREVMEQQKLFESVVDSLNSTFQIPKVVDVQLTDCGTINAWYDPKNTRLIMCYEMIGSFIEIFKPMAKNDEELFSNVFGGTFFVFLHEFGHSLAHLLALPITGKEEDAVDQLATIVLLFGGEDGVNAALAAAQRFYIRGEQAGTRDLPFWDEHSLGQQRFYNISCLIFGSDPKKYAGLVGDNMLPKERAQRCTMEYQQASNAWLTLLKPYIKADASKGPGIAPPTAKAPTTPNNTTKDPISSPPINTSKTPEVIAGTGTNLGTADTAACEETSDHVINLIMDAASKELKTMDKESAGAARQELLERVLALSDEMLNSCVSTPWPTSLQSCIKKSKSLDQAEKCLPK